MKATAFLIFLGAATNLVTAQTYLSATGTGDTYDLINSKLGAYGTGENPDCSHTSFGRHIFQGLDGQLNRQVFFFHAHRDQDNDRCQTFDRQRNEIRPDQGALTGNDGTTMSFSWIFKLDAGFQPSTSFTHIHQLKAQGGDDSMPIITFTPRYKSTGGHQMELTHVNSAGTTTILRSAPLSGFLGNWVKVVERVTFGTTSQGGKYQVTMSLLSNGQSLLSYPQTDIQMWRQGAGYYRPKWGIYRSLQNKQQLRDEIVRFNDFCMHKGNGCN